MTDDAFAKIEGHERECALRFQAIEARLERGSARMDRLETQMSNLLFATLGVYPFILGSVFLAKYL
tara:strand:+ start:1176 stop:1373 length:198 start_codon:yes stop_codon:yes gene_type:complete